jgi:peptidoglycan/LPS O-acetylase OafA/YrhL
MTMRPGAQFSSTRIPGIDSLRGLCILAVILLHINLRIPFEKNFIGARFSHSTLSAIFRSGHYGVIVFFVISGFLITSVSLKRWGGLQNIKPVEFYEIRFARIAPCLVGLLVVLSFLHLGGVQGFVISQPRISLWRAIWSAITFHLNWLEAKFGYLPGGWDVLWSLSVEEAFYFGFPLVCRWIRSSAALFSIMAGFVIVGPFARTVFTKNPMWADHSYLSCMDGIALGFFAACIKNKFEFRRKTQLAFAIAGSAAMFAVVFFKGAVAGLGLYRTGLDVTVLEIAAACFILGVQTKTSGGARLSPLRWLGKNSYEVYLTHMFVVTFLVRGFYAMRSSVNMAPAWYVVILCLSGLSGDLVAWCYSEPLNRRIRGKFFPPAAARAAMPGIKIQVETSDAPVEESQKVL